MRKVILAVVILAAAGVGVWLAARAPQQGALSMAPSDSPRPAMQVESRPESQRGAGQAPSPARKHRTSDGTATVATLPPLDTPIAAILDELEARAKAGDARAACRVAMEKWRCQETLSMQFSAEDAKARPELAAASRQNQTRCSGVDGARFNDAWKYLAQSALSGNVAAMSLYGRSPPIAFLDQLDAAEALIIYRDNAERFLAQAIEGGDVMALYAMWWHSSTSASSDRKVFKVDPYRAAVYGTALTPLLDERRRGNVDRLGALLSQQLGAGELAKARAEGEQLRARRFASSPRALDSQNDAYFLPGDCER